MAKISVSQRPVDLLEAVRAECHVFRGTCGPQGRSLCGKVPRREQAIHSTHTLPGTPFSNWHGGRCVRCGLQVCRPCADMHMGAV